MDRPIDIFISHPSDANLAVLEMICRNLSSLTAYPHDTTRNGYHFCASCRRKKKRVWLVACPYCRHTFHVRPPRRNR